MSLIKIDFYPDAKKQPRARPLVAQLKVTDANRQATFKLGFFSKEIVGEEFIEVACHDPKVAAQLAAALRATALELDAAVAKSINPFAR